MTVRYLESVLVFCSFDFFFLLPGLSRSCLLQYGYRAMVIAVFVVVVMRQTGKDPKGLRGDHYYGIQEMACRLLFIFFFFFDVTTFVMRRSEKCL